MLSACYFLVVNGPQLQEEENLCIWNLAGFKRGVQQTSDDMSHAAVSPRSLSCTTCLIQEPHSHAPSLKCQRDDGVAVIPNAEPGLRVNSIIKAFLHSKLGMQWLPYID